ATWNPHATAGPAGRRSAPPGDPVRRATAEGGGDLAASTPVALMKAGEPAKARGASEAAGRSDRNGTCNPHAPGGYAPRMPTPATERSTQDRWAQRAVSRYARAAGGIN